MFWGVSCFCADSDNGDHYGVTTESKKALIPTETAESAELHDTSKKTPSYLFQIRSQLLFKPKALYIRSESLVTHARWGLLT